MAVDAEALRRILAEGSHLRAAWEHRGEASWFGYATATYDKLRHMDASQKYSPTSHKIELQRLAQAAPIHQQLFALWCLEPVWLVAKSSLESRLSPEQWRHLLSLHEVLWAQTRSGEPKVQSTAEAFDAAMRALDFEDCPQSVMAVADAANCLAHGRWLDAATSSGLAMTFLIERCLDELSVDTPMPSAMRRECQNAPAIFGELDLQRVMIDSLLEGRPLIDVREQRRTVWETLKYREW